MRFKEWLYEDAGPLGPSGATQYQNDRKYRAKGVRSKWVAADEDEGEDFERFSPGKLFGKMKKKMKKQHKYCRKG